jgi:putative addiction module killer protein
MEIREYVSRNGKAVFSEWLRKLKDRQARARIHVQIDRLALGQTGDSKALGGGIHELRIHYGPGYRVYYAMAGRRIILLLCGGDKSTQQQDILLARHHWQDYRDR